jgi:hypothetical protein
MEATYERAAITRPIDFKPLVGRAALPGAANSELNS